MASSRSSLMAPNSSAFADIGTTSWGIDDDDDQPLDIQVSVTDLKSEQKRLLEGTKLFHLQIKYF